MTDRYIIRTTGQTGPSGTATGVDAADVTFTPTGSIAATDVQAAITEVATDAAAAYATSAAVASAVSTHESDTTNVHGIADTSVLLTTTAAPELIRDTIGTALTAGTGITITPNDGADTITVASSITQYTDEMARDALGTALVAGTNITITPNDGADTITIAASAGGSVAADAIFDAKGDLPVGTGADTAAKLTVGANGRVLIADSSQTTGLRWGAANPGPYTGYVSGSYYSPARAASNHAATSWGANQLWFVPFFVTTDTTFDALQIYLSATANVRLGLYAADGTAGVPGTLVTDFGVIAGTGAGDKTMTGLSVSLKGGTWHWLALVGDTTVTYGSMTAAQLQPLNSNAPSAGSLNFGLYRIFTYGALPTPAGSLTATPSAPCILLRAA